MKVLLAWALLILLSGCIPIGFQGRTSSLAAPGSAAGARSAIEGAAPVVGGLSA